MVTLPTGQKATMNQHSTIRPFDGGGEMKREEGARLEKIGNINTASVTVDRRHIQLAQLGRVSSDSQLASTMFKQFVNNALSERLAGNSKLYQELRRKFTLDPSDSDAPSSLELRQMVNALTQCVSRLDKSCSNLVFDILRTTWAGRDSLFYRTYLRFLGNLVSAHSIYVPMVTKMLVEYLALKSSRICTLPNNQPVTRQTIYDRAHEALRYIVELAPTSTYSTLFPALVAEFPNVSEKRLAHTTYVTNLLRVIDYLPAFKSKILAMIMERIIKIDIEIQADLEDLEDEDGHILVSEISKGDELDDKSDDSSETLEDYDGEELNSITRIKEMVDKLDALLEILFDFYSRSLPTEPSSTFDAGMETFQHLLDSFDNTVLPTYQSRYTQFIMFWAVQKSPQFMDIFLGELVGCATDSNKSQLMRQAAAAYVASFVARAKMMDRDSVRSVVCFLCNWLNSFMVLRESSCSGPDIGKYGAFYSVFQAVLYIFCFKWKDLRMDDDDDNNSFRESKWLPALLVLQRAIISRFNPLKVCSQIVVDQFAKIANFLNFLYCYSVMESNKRCVIGGVVGNYDTPYGDTRLGRGAGTALEAYFPFDPYKLKRSRRWIEDYYVEWEPIPGLDDDEDDDDDGENDDNYDEGVDGDEEMIDMDREKEDTESGQETDVDGA